MLSKKKKNSKVVQQSTVVVLHFYPEEPYFFGAVRFAAPFCGLYGRSSQEWISGRSASAQRRLTCFVMEKNLRETKPNAL